MTNGSDWPDERPRVSSGAQGLDDILLGGWPADHIYLIEGTPGAGKTTLALKFLIEGAQRGERVLYVTLAESKFELQAVARSHDMDLTGVEIQEYSPDEQSLRKESEYSALYPSEVEFHDAIQTILDRVEEVRPVRLVLDSLAEIRILAREPVRYRRQILALKHFFLNRNTTVLMLDEPQSAQPDHQVQSIAHGVLVLERLPRDYGVERRRLRVAKLRGSTFREGFHDYRVDRGGLKVYPRLVASEYPDRTLTGLITSGLSALDDISGGGIPKGTATVIKGPAGTGKSTVVMQYACSFVRNGGRAVLYQFDETISSAIARSNGLGMQVDPLLASGRLVIKQCDPAEITPGEFVANVREAVELGGVEMIAIDTVNGLLNAMAGEERLLLLMHELCTYLNQRGVLTFLIFSQSGVVSSQGLPGTDLSYLADNVMLLSYFEAFGEVRRAMSVLKMRMRWHEPSIRELRFTKGSMQSSEPLREFHGILSGIPTYTGSQAGLGGAASERPEA